MSKKLVTNRGEYPVIFCATINKGILMEIEDDRPIHVVAEEFEELESMQYVNTDIDSGRTYECPLRLKMIQAVDENVKQIRVE